jgi:hypothetical protein
MRPRWERKGSAPRTSRASAESIEAVAGATGLAYEEHFAVHRLLEAALERRLGGVREALTSQAFCFVDDLVVRSGSRFEFCQLKKSARESWESSKGKLKHDFRRQKSSAESSGSSSSSCS